MDGRLPAHLEASSLLRRAESEGGFGMILGKGDRDSGALVLVIASRGAHFACLERQYGPTGYAWQNVGPAPGASSAEVVSWAETRRKFDPDCWLIELDIPLAERFIAETTAIG
jgi:hypothetical protein